MLQIDELDATKTALLVVDMEQQFIDNRPGYHNLAGRLNNFTPYLRAANIPIHWCVMVDKYTHIPQSAMGKDFFLQRVGISGADYESDHFFIKRSYSAFAHTKLRERLKAEGIEHLLVAGVHTFDCVENTIFDAAGDFDVGLIWDLTGDSQYKNMEMTRRRLTGNTGIASRASFVLSDQILAELNGCMYRNDNFLSINDLPQLVA